MSDSVKASGLRIALGSILIAIMASFHFNMLLAPSAGGKVAFFAVLLAFIGSIMLAKKRETVENVKHFQYKTLSILSFLLPVSSIFFTFVMGAKAVDANGSEAAKAGAAVGSFIGGGIVTFFAFIIGLSLGIVFYIMSRKKTA